MYVGVLVESNIYTYIMLQDNTHCAEPADTGLLQRVSH
jgi:hypothetical protein